MESLGNALKISVTKTQKGARQAVLSAMPVPGCCVKPQIWLTLHFNTAHPNIKGERRQKKLPSDSVRLAWVLGGGQNCPAQKMNQLCTSWW